MTGHVCAVVNHKFFLKGFAGNMNRSKNIPMLKTWGYF